MAIQSQPSRIPEPFAGSGTKNTIPATNSTPSASQAASWASGFPPECSQPISAGGCPVPRNDMNGALNQLSQDYSFRQDGGVWGWSALADYDASRVVRGSDGKLYCSAAQSGPSSAAGTKDPVADDGTYWVLLPTQADVAQYVAGQGYALDSDVVHKTGDENINGTKLFFKDTIVSNSEPKQTIHNDNYVIYSSPDSDRFWYGAMFLDKTYNWIGAVGRYVSAARNAAVFLSSMSGVTTNDTAEVLLYQENNGNKFFRPAYDNYMYLGAASYRWNQVFAATSTINTSDERLKSSISLIPDTVLDAWGDVGFVQFQFNDAIKEKGGSARLHSGLVAQRIDEAFKARGLDASRYGLFCYDSWEEKEAVCNGEKVVDPALPQGDVYSLRYEEALCMEAAFQRRRADRAEARLAALEERLAAIESKLG